MIKHLLALIGFVAVVTVNGQQPVFFEPIREAYTAFPQYIHPQERQLLDINIEALRADLHAVPTEEQTDLRKSPYILKLITPEGAAARFRLVEVPVMHPDLAARYPLIKTYAGLGLDDPTASLRLDITYRGLHAQVLSKEGHWFIDPLGLGETRFHQSYYKKDLTATHPLFEPEYEDDAEALTAMTSVTLAGSERREYRLALSTTGEYSTFHGGTPASVMSAVVTTMNRVNGVYERDACIRMILVPNNDQLFFYNSSTDPFSNYNANDLVFENQDVCDSIIGFSNYDIGHNFGTGGGGFAPGAVCSMFKAGGITGGPSPVGDPFDIDYVAHEMGHQFDADHTQNNACNRVNSAAYEPGSASTIMGYAGICPPNLQNNSDAYFHVYSIQQITNYSQTGTGNFCAVTAPSGNTAPTVTVPTGGFYIPKSTPFKLTGSATDPDGDTLTYCWEEYDLGPSGSPTSPSGNAPIFRSWEPTETPTRIFPRMSTILNGNGPMGELLPAYGRSLKFRLTVRDNFPTAGGVAYDQVNFLVDGNSGPFSIQIPNDTFDFGTNGAHTVYWDVSGTDAGNVNCQTVNIYLSRNNGNTWPDTLALGVPNSGNWVWNVPAGYESTNARIMVEAADNIFFTVSKRFDINTGFIGLKEENLLEGLSAMPNPSSGHFRLTWNQSGPGQTGIRVMHLSGQEVYSAGFRGKSGKNSADLDLNHLPAGIYVLRVSAGNSSGHLRLVLTN